MSLNWNIEKVRDWKQITEAASDRVVTDALVWLTMSVGIDHITAANASEFYSRVHRLEMEAGHYLLTKEGKPSPITLADVERRIGLYTNAGTKTKREFEATVARLKKAL